MALEPLNCGLSHLDTLQTLADDTLQTLADDTLQTLADDLPFLQFYQPCYLCVVFPAK